MFRRIQHDVDGRITVVERIYTEDMRDDPSSHIYIIEDDSISDLDLCFLWYYENEQRLPRLEAPISIDKTSIIADGIDTAILTGLPNPTKIVVGDNLFTVIVEDGSLELTFDLPGTYQIHVDPFPFQYQEVQIVAS